MIVVAGLFIFLFSSSGSSSIDVYFSPNDHIRTHIIGALDKAKASVDIAMFSFTDRPLAQKIINLSKQKVTVRVLLDTKNAVGNLYSKAKYLTNHGVNVKYAAVISLYGIDGIMHNKFAVIDKKTVLTGSYNWTASANSRNNENMLIIHNKRIGALYEKEFVRLWKNGTKEIKRRKPDVIQTKEQIKNHIGKIVILDGIIKRIRKGRKASFVYLKNIKRFKIVVFDTEDLQWKAGDSVKFLVLIEKSNRYGLEGIFQQQ